MSNESPDMASRVFHLLNLLTNELSLQAIERLADRAYAAQRSRCDSEAQREELRCQIDQASRDVEKVAIELKSDANSFAKAVCIVSAMELTCAQVPHALWIEIFRDSYALLDLAAAQRRQ